MDKLSYHRHRYPSIVIQQAIWLYFRFALSYRDVEDMKGCSEAELIVFVIDDDASVRQALQSLVRSVGLQAPVFGSTAEFLSSDLPDVASCLVLDVRLPGVSGLDFQNELAKARILVPIIFITGHGDIPMSVKAMKAGAVEFLTKPFRDQELLDAIEIALNLDRTRRENAKAVSNLRALFEIIDPPRTGGDGPGHGGPHEQTDRRPIERQRGHRKGSSRQCHGKDACEVSG